MTILAGGAESGDSSSLQQLLCLPLEERWQRIFEFGKYDLLATIRELQEHSGVFQAGMSAERLAWALAFNVGGTAACETSLNKPQRGTQGYRDHWPSDTSWNKIWSVLSKPFGSANPNSSTLLTELALSVACEQRDDWQYPPSRPIFLQGANQAFQVVYAANRQKVVGGIRQRFGTRAGDPEDIVDEAWTRVFCDYWSVKARRRFCADSRISTLVYQVAWFVAMDILRDGGASTRTDDGDLEATLERIGIPLEDLGPGANPEEILSAKQLLHHIRLCLERQPAKRQIVAALVWLRDIPARRVAQERGISEAAVSQHLKKARDSILNCLFERGFYVGGRN
jgi:RNA polymerase sigma factor (sigma-70 family)